MAQWQQYQVEQTLVKKIISRSNKRFRAARRWIEGNIEKVVHNGPFKGMKYVDDAVGSSFIPKVMGTYELELIPAINRLLGIQFDTIIDVGAAEGYYSVGFALQQPQANHIAFEIEEKGQTLLKEMAKLNGLEGKINVKSECDTQSLNEAIPSDGSSLLIMDVEGAEEFLLDPQAIVQLMNCHVLVELHDRMVNGIGEAIHDRFCSSHDIEQIESTYRTKDDVPADLPDLPWWITKGLIGEKLIVERDCHMRWYLMIPNKSSSNFRQFQPPTTST
jgi:hypothetical protein